MHAGAVATCAASAGSNSVQAGFGFPKVLGAPELILDVEAAQRSFTCFNHGRPQLGDYPSTSQVDQAGSDDEMALWVMGAGGTVMGR